MEIRTRQSGRPRLRHANPAPAFEMDVCFQVAIDSQIASQAPELRPLLLDLQSDLSEREIARRRHLSPATVHRRKLRLARILRELVQ